MVAELLIFMYIYITGGHGTRALQTLHCSLTDMEKSCTQLEQGICTLQTSIHRWEKYPFYTEQRARAQLYLGYPEETWYWYGG